MPPGFAVTTAAYERDDIDEAVGEAYAELGRRVGRADPPVAVRSSAIAEDMPDASFAGVQDTYLWICGLDAVLDGIRRCWASFHNPEAVAYREAHGITRGGMSVAVQYMVDARVAGVMFTLNPVSGDRSSIAIDASYGLGSLRRRRRGDARLVPRLEGDARDRAPPDRRQGDRGRGRSRRPRRRSRATCPRNGRRRPSLSDDEIARLAEIGRRIEAHYGRPQDIEWAIDRQLDELFILQSRPETVWSNKPRPQAVDRRRDGADHGDDDRRRGEAEGMSDSPDLTPDDVKEILRLVDESQFDEFELETPRLTIRFRRGERRAAPRRRRAATPRPAEAPRGPRRRHGADGRDVLPRAGPGRAAVRRGRQPGRGAARRSASSRS